MDPRVPLRVTSAKYLGMQDRARRDTGLFLPHQNPAGGLGRQLAGKTPPQAGEGAESGQASPLQVGDWMQGGSIISGWALVLAFTFGPI